MAGLSDKAQRSRQAILDAAGRLFAERGYSGASVHAIVESAGVTKGGLYFHFTSKRELALAVIAGPSNAGPPRNRGGEAPPARRRPLFALPGALARLAGRGGAGGVPPAP